MTTIKEVNMGIKGICGVCGFPPGQRGYVRVDVAVGHPDFGKPIPCPQCNERKVVKEQAQHSQLTGWLGLASFDNYGGDHDGNGGGLEAAKRFVSRPIYWLTFYGGYGRGKTHLLAAIANDCGQKGLAALYYTLPDWLDLLRGSYEGGSDPFEVSKTVRVLLLDEVDKVHWTDWAIEKIYQLIDARYRLMEEKGTVFALNVDPHEALTSGNNQSIHYLFSRMLDERSKVVKMAGKDARPVARRLWKKGDIK